MTPQQDVASRAASPGARARRPPRRGASPSEPRRPFPGAAALSQNAQECGECHNADNPGTITVDGEAKPLAVDLDAYEASLHGQLDCTGCHIGFEPGPHSAAQTEGWLQTAKLDSRAATATPTSSRCTRNRSTATWSSTSSPTTRPLCADCHAPHDIVAPDSLEFRRSTLDLCSELPRREERDLPRQLPRQGVPARQGRRRDLHRLPRRSQDPARFGPRQHDLRREPWSPRAAVPSRRPTRTSPVIIVHVDPKDPTDSFWVFVFWLAYVLLIAVVFTFGGVHTVMYIYRGIKDGLYGRKHH